jgi:hypothetical protein
LANASSASSQFDGYRDKFAVRPPDLSRKGSDDELADLTFHDDVSSLAIAPASGFDAGAPARMPRSSGAKMYLWLVAPSDVVIALEEGTAGQSTTRSRLAHTNLSGGGDAHAGGELWFNDSTSIWFTGGSSRYAPRSRTELDMIVAAFRTSGYRVSSCGWDEENDMPARFFRGQDIWR